MSEYLFDLMDHAPVHVVRKGGVRLLEATAEIPDAEFGYRSVSAAFDEVPGSERRRTYCGHTWCASRRGWSAG